MSRKNLRKRVLFVCMGNICRSPTGEGVLRSLLAARGVSERVEVDSAGTIDHHAGEHPDYRMQHAASRRGYRLAGRARQITSADLDAFDLVVAMDRENLADIHALVDQRSDLAHVRLLSDFLEGQWPPDVPDPYYGGEDGFDQVIDMIEAACPRILDELLGPGNQR